MSAPAIAPPPPPSPAGAAQCAPSTRPNGRPNANRAARRPGSWPLVILLIGSLICAGAVREWAARWRGETIRIGETNSATPLSRMDSFALALLLGGLRGPLVMILWTSSESQKQQKDLDDFDTKVEWIRLLQPEFDTVHIFQIWNKAYNISVLKASLSNKYLTILDALDYAWKVDRERPDDINIIYAIGGVFFDKLDQSQEKHYYRGRVRAETQQHPPAQKLSRDDPAWRRLELDPVLDKNGYLLPSMLRPTSTLLVDSKDPSLRYDGSELEYLAPYQPFPDGVPPVALGYNYQTRAAMLQLLGHQRHAQLSDMVLDSRPALTLKFWSEEELERGRRIELAALGKPVPPDAADPGELEQPAAAVSLDVPLDDRQRAAVEHARSEYALAARLCNDSLALFHKHLLRYQRNIETARIHMDTLAANIDLSSADRDYLAAMLAKPADRPAIVARAVDEYRRALRDQQLMIFRYYISDEAARVILPPGVDRAHLEKIDPALYAPIVEEIKRRVLILGQFNEAKDDIATTVHYIGRINTRLAMLGG